MQQQRLHFPALLNARDLGGHPTLDGGVTRSRSLLRADDLAQLNAEGVEALARYGVETVIDLRWPAEVARHPNPIPTALPQVRYVQLSLLTPSEDEWRLRCPEPTKELWKCAALEGVGAELRTVLGVIAAATPGALLFHCVAGKDRTGLIAALLLTLADAEPEAIARDYVASSENLREGYLKRYPNTEPARILAALHCPEVGVHNMLKFLAEGGGVRAYLRRIGLGEDEIARLRARLRD
ncbi:MAG TPA: tyrosine-protein phosphatase [Steroidobacteraceae bacterium]|nr:tyrosine-protein phosphatase [Steroidobacteraceae bacterium]